MKNKGKIGEDQAVEFLKKNQFSICMRNFTTRFGELDIIAKKNERFHKMSGSQDQAPYRDQNLGL